MQAAAHKNTHTLKDRCTAGDEHEHKKASECNFYHAETVASKSCVLQSMYYLLPGKRMMVVEWCKNMDLSPPAKKN